MRESVLRVLPCGEVLGPGLPEMDLVKIYERGRTRGTGSVSLGTAIPTVHRRANMTLRSLSLALLLLKRYG